eukprot:jgi/Psemu1/301949/fgenesh1_kg.52_\
MILPNVSSYALGLVFIVLVAIIWSAASVVVQYVYSNSFDAPFLLTYIGTSLFVVQLPLHWLYKRSKIWDSNCNSHFDHNYETIPTGEATQLENENVEGDGRESTACDSSTCSNNIDNENIADETPMVNQNEHHWTEKDHMIAAAKLSPFWFISNYAYNASLLHTSITSSTVLVNTGSLFTFLIALLMKDERFSVWKLLGVLFGMTGCILTARHDAREGEHGGGRRLRFLFAEMDDNTGYTIADDDGDDLHFWGDILSVISAAFYGIYAVMIRVLCPRDENLMSMQLFLGYVGLWNMLLLSPVAIYQLGIAKSVTLSLWIFFCLVVNGFFNNVLSDYLWARSVVLTSATVATVGLGLTIPLAFASDVFLGVEDVLNSESILGAVFVLLGFVLVNIGQTKDDTKNASDRSRTQSEGDEELQSISMQTVTVDNNSG